MTEPAPVPTSGAVLAIVSLDQPCLCSYNLRGLALTGTCPECNRPVADSLPAFPLVATTPQYRASLVRGLSLVCGGTALALISIITGSVLAAVGRDPPDWAGVIVFWLALAAILAGYWLYTTPDPFFAGGREPVLSRRVLRISATVSVVSFVIGSASSFTDGASEAFAPLAELIRVFSPFAAVLAFAAHFFAMMHYTQWTVSRIPQHVWARRIRRYMWLLPVLVAAPFPLLFLIAFMILSIAEPRESTVMSALFITSCAVLGFILIAAILFTHMLFAVRRCLQRLDEPRT